MILDENPEVMLIRLAEEKDEALREYGIAYAFLMDCFSKYQDEIYAITEKKFIGNDSRCCCVLDWGYKQPKETRELIAAKYAEMIISGKKAEGLTARFDALNEAMKYQTSKWKNEREATK